jgi:uncharacterized protein (TIGR02466 family)
MFQTSDWKAASDCEQLDLFSIPFLRGQFKEIDLETVKQDCRDLVAEARKEHHNDFSKNYTTYFDEHLRHKMTQLPWYKEFSEQVKDTYIQFINTCYSQEVSHLKRSDLHLFAWISVYNEPHQHTSHNHINSYMSGTWYVKTGEEESQPIKFENPNRAMAHALNLPVNEWGREDIPNAKFIGGANYHDEIEFYPNEGQFLMWPSPIMHSVPPLINAPDGYERIAISFNLHHPVDVHNQNESGDDLDYGFLGTNIQDESIPEIPPAVIEDVKEQIKKGDHLEISHDIPQSHTKPKGVLF